MSLSVAPSSHGLATRNSAIQPIPLASSPTNEWLTTPVGAGNTDHHRNVATAPISIHSAAAQVVRRSNAPSWWRNPSIRKNENRAVSPSIHDA